MISLMNKDDAAAAPKGEVKGEVVTMQNKRRIMADLKETASLPGIAVCPKDGRLDLLFSTITFPLDGSSLIMPCLIHLETDYPCSPPNVGFPVHFDYSMGASFVESCGPLAQCMVLCLNITGNFRHIHDEWASKVGEGWSASMTLSSLCVQLQSMLSDVASSMIASSKKELRQRLEKFTFQVDDEHQHSFEQPYPEVSSTLPASEGAGAAAADSELNSDRAKCYVTGSTDAEDTLGIGFSLERGNASTPAEILSWRAFNELKVRQSCSKEPFAFFWPLLPVGEGRPEEFNSVQKLCTGVAQRVLGCPESDALVVVTTKLINGIIVEMMKGEKRDATRYFDILLQLRRLLRHHLNTSQGAARGQLIHRVQQFVSLSTARHKDIEPNLGDFLALYLCLPEAVPIEPFLGAFIDENFLRCVMWWKRAGCPDRAADVFQATKVSRSICLFQMSVLAIVVVAEGGEAGAAGVDTVRTLDAFQQQWRELEAEVERGGWAAFFQRSGCSAQTSAAILRDLDGWIASCVQRAVDLGPKYSSFASGGAGGPGGGGWRGAGGGGVGGGPGRGGGGGWGFGGGGRPGDHGRGFKGGRW